MNEFILSIISSVISAASVGLTLWFTVVERRERAHKLEMDAIHAKFEALEKSIKDNVNDINAATKRNTEQFLVMKEAFTVHSTKMGEFEKSFERRMDRYEREVEKIDLKVEAVRDRNYGRVIRKDQD